MWRPENFLPKLLQVGKTVTRWRHEFPMLQEFGMPMWFPIEVGLLNGTELLLDFNTMLSLKSEFIFVFDFQ